LNVLLNFVQAIVAEYRKQFKRKSESVKTL
jgi:hypothetical protein